MEAVRNQSSSWLIENSKYADGLEALIFKMGYIKNKSIPEKAESENVDPLLERLLGN